MEGTEQSTVTTAVSLSSLPHEFVTRTQYEVVCVGAGSYVADVASSIGESVLPVMPMYH
jgi:hypothetical protein